MPTPDDYPDPDDPVGQTTGTVEYNLEAEYYAPPEAHPRTDWGDVRLSFLQYERTKVYPAGAPELAPTWWSALAWNLLFYPFRFVRHVYMMSRRRRNVDASRSHRVRA